MGLAAHCVARPWSLVPEAPPDKSLPLRPGLHVGLQQVWRGLGETGTWLTGAQRVAAVRASRQSVSKGEHQGGRPGLDAAATVIATQAASLQKTDLERFGLDALQWVELVGVVSRAVAIDTTHRGLGRPLSPLPTAQPGSPSRQPNPRAKKRSAWVPIQGAAGATTALSAVPTESATQRQLSALLYLDYPEMAELGATRAGLHRPQMELVAARTSWINDCFY